MYFVYILQSLKDQTFYIGQTEDLQKRLNLHNEGQSRYTSKKVPWKIVYFESMKPGKKLLQERGS
ncbi:MAG: GIY-YIG nuclease family protein [Christiangramia sp.]|nr:GIY-YIG nuclease family protein [Christiangramia sp.]